MRTYFRFQIKCGIKYYNDIRVLLLGGFMKEQRYTKAHSFAGAGIAPPWD